MPELHTAVLLMSRPRAFLALLIAVTWCSAAWHVDLEAVGIMLEHEHRAHDDHDGRHGPVDGHEDHEQIVARDLAKDPLRVGSGATLWSAFLGLGVWLAARFRSSGENGPIPRQWREAGPPLVRVWQFVQRCAPLAAAPPGLR